MTLSWALLLVVSLGAGNAAAERTCFTFDTRHDPAKAVPGPCSLGDVDGRVPRWQFLLWKKRPGAEGEYWTDIQADESGGRPTLHNMPADQDLRVMALTFNEDHDWIQLNPKPREYEHWALVNQALGRPLWARVYAKLGLVLDFGNKRLHALEESLARDAPDEQVLPLAAKLAYANGHRALERGFYDQAPSWLEASIYFKPSKDAYDALETAQRLSGKPGRHHHAAPRPDACFIFDTSGERAMAVVVTCPDGGKPRYPELPPAPPGTIWQRRGDQYWTDIYFRRGADGLTSLGDGRSFKDELRLGVIERQPDGTFKELNPSSADYEHWARAEEGLGSRYWTVVYGMLASTAGGADLNALLDLLNRQRLGNSDPAAQRSAIDVVARQELADARRAMQLGDYNAADRWLYAANAHAPSAETANLRAELQPYLAAGAARSIARADASARPSARGAPAIPAAASAPLAPLAAQPVAAPAPRPGPILAPEARTAEPQSGAALLRWPGGAGQPLNAAGADAPQPVVVVQQTQTNAEAARQTFTFIMVLGVFVSSVFMVVMNVTRKTRKALPAVVGPDDATLVDGVAQAGTLSTAGPPQLARYELKRRVGAGGMGVVYEGFVKRLGRRVAVKQLRRELREDPREREKFLSEARIAAALAHPHVVGFQEVVEEDGQLFLVFDYVDGKPLSEVLREKKRLSVPETQRVFTEVCQAISFAHRNHVLHRDLKPSNIMLDADGHAKVMDFGIARQAKETITRLTNADASGTPAYMAPEQHLGRCNKASDVYALGVCLYEALTGQLPFKGPDFLAQKERMLYHPPQFVIPTLPKVAELLFQVTLAADPDKRVADAEELIDSLRRLSA